ncbi:MAG: hypothetical protein CVV53_03585 [Spirochaetae bacterium HGW-Spirochaetae-9]|nr:MAG: hypothetical protein CVV53_03585 [Spirochaetae bacterium HGW-Spirochaetae-9]
MRIVIDMQGLQHRDLVADEGSGQDLHFLVRDFVELAARGGHEIFLALNGTFKDSVEPIRAEYSRLLPREHVKCWQQYLSPVSGYSGDDWARHASELVREWYIGQLNPDLVWITDIFCGWLDDSVISARRLADGALQCITMQNFPNPEISEPRMADRYQAWRSARIDCMKRSDLVVILTKNISAEVFAAVNVSEGSVTKQNPSPILLDLATSSVEGLSRQSKAQALLNSFEARLRRSPESIAIKRIEYNKDPTDYGEIIGKLAEISEPSERGLFKMIQALRDNTIPSEGKRGLFLDLSTLVHFDCATGIQRVVRAITNELQKMDLPDLDIATVFSYPGHRQYYRTERLDDKYVIPDKDRLPESEVDFREGDILVLLDLNMASAISKKDEIARLRNMGVKVYYVVYDLLPLSFPHYFVPELSEEFTRWIPVVLASDGALCISRDVADKLATWVKEHRLKTAELFKISHFHLGADVQQSMPSKGMPKNAKVVLDYYKRNLSFLMVGTVEPRKAHGYALDAFESMWRQGIDALLVIVGHPGWRNQATVERLRRHEENGKRLFWLENASDEYLECIYAASTCLIAASEGEGFGLPLIEAAQHKLPIIARDLPVFREVAGDHAYYFPDDKSPEVLAEAVKDWIGKYRENKYPKSDKMPWLTWRQSAEQFLYAIRFQTGIDKRL